MRNTISSSWMRLVLAQLATVYCLSGVIRSDELDPKTFFELLTAREQLGERYSWDCDYVGLRGKRTFATGAIKAQLEAWHAAGLKDVLEDDPYRVKTTAVYEPGSGRFRIEASLIQRWEGGPFPAISERLNWAFDGKMYSVWRRSRRGTELPPLEIVESQQADESLGRPTGSYSQTNEEAEFLSGLFFWSGISALPTFIEPLGDQAERPCRITTYFRAKLNEGRLKVYSISKDLVRAECAIDIAKGRDKNIVRYDFDPTRGWVFIRATRHVAAGYPPHEEVSIEPREWQPGHWFPETVTRYRWIDALGSRHRISNVKIVPAADERSFRIEMPQGTEVTDHVNEMAYLVSPVPVEEASAAQQYLRTHRVPSIRRPNGLDDDSGTGRRTLLIFNSILVALGVIFFFRRRYLRKRNSGQFLIGLLLLAGGQSKANQVDEVREALSAEVTRSSAPAVAWNNGWEVTLPDIGPVRMSQCGLNVAYTMLHAFERQFDPIVVARLLEPSRNGIRMSDLQKVLRAHGIDAIPRTRVSLQEIISFLRDDAIVLVAVPPGVSKSVTRPVSHYVLIALNEAREPIVLDPPRGIKRLRTWAKADVERFPDLTVLICQLHEKPLAANLIVSNNRLEISSKDAAAVRRTVETKLILKNPSETPIAITRIDLPCGCIKMDFDGGIIEPNRSIPITMSIEKSRWGVGRQRKEIRFMCSDRSTCPVAIEGELIAASESAFLNFDVGTALEIPAESGADGGVWEHEVGLPRSKLDPEEIRIESTEPYCTATLAKNDKGLSAKLAVILRSEDLRRLGAGEPMYSRIVLMHDSQSESFGSVNLVVTRAKVAQFEPPVVTSRNGVGASTLKLNSALKPGWRLAGVQALGGGASATAEYQGDGTWSVSCAHDGSKSEGVVVLANFEHDEYAPSRVRLILVPGR